MTEMASTIGHTAPHRVTASAGQSRINDGLGLALLAFLAIIPIPLGANNPVVWSLSAALLGLGGMLYIALLLRVQGEPRVALTRLRLETAALIALIVFLFVQFLPIGLWGVPTGSVDAEGNLVEAHSISLTPGATALMALRMASYGVFFWLCIQVTSNRRRAALLSELALYVFAAHALFGLFSLVFLDDTLLIFDKWAYEGVATGTFVNRNSFATFLAIGLVLATSNSLRFIARLTERNRKPNSGEKLAKAGLLIIVTFVILAALLATQSRMGLFAGLLGSSIILVSALLKTGTRRRSVAALTAAFLVLFAVLALLGFGEGTLERLGSVENSADVRISLYQQVGQMIASNWLVGTGGGSFEISYTLFHRWPVSPDRIWDKAHSTYLTLWSELGVVFGSLPLLIYLLLSWRCVRLVVLCHDDWLLPLTSLAAIVVVAVHSLVDFSMEIQGVVFPCLFVVALGTRSGSRSRREVALS